MINKVGRFCLAKGVKLVWLFHTPKNPEQEVTLSLHPPIKAQP